MTKEQLIEAVAKKCGCPKSQVAETLNNILDEISKALSRGGEVVLTGFGSFKVAKRTARMGINPKTRAKIKIPAMKVPRFKAGKSLKDAVR